MRPKHLRFLITGGRNERFVHIDDPAIGQPGDDESHRATIKNGSKQLLMLRKGYFASFALHELFLELVASFLQFLEGEAPFAFVAEYGDRRDRGEQNTNPDQDRLHEPEAKYIFFDGRADSAFDLKKSPQEGGKSAGHLHPQIGWLTVSGLLAVELRQNVFPSVQYGIEFLDLTSKYRDSPYRLNPRPKSVCHGSETRDT